MSFILQPVAGSDVVTSKAVIASAFNIPSGSRGLVQSSITISSSGPGSISIPGGQFLQVLQTS